MFVKVIEMNQDYLFERLKWEHDMCPFCSIMKVIKRTRLMSDPFDSSLNQDS